MLRIFLIKQIFGNFNVDLNILPVKEAGGLVLDMEQEDTRTEDLPMVLNSGNLMAASFNLSQKIAKILK